MKDVWAPFDQARDSRSVVSQSGGVSLVEIEGVGQIQANATVGVANGQAVTLAVRPERMELGNNSASDSSNHIHGIVVEVVFVGNDTQYFVLLPNGSRIMVRQQNKTPLADTPAVIPSQEVTVHWSAASTNLLLK